MVITSGLTNAASARTASDIQLGSCVTEIGQGAFSGYSNITEIEFPDALTTIGNYAFQNCDNLSAVTIHSGITSIGSSAFTDCDSLEKITFESDTPITLGNIRPFGGEVGYPLYVPFESYGSYVSAWSYYKNRITYEGMPYMAKIYSDSTEQISYIPCSPSSTTITDARPIVSAFTSPIVEFGDCVTTIGNDAFRNSSDYYLKTYETVILSSGLTSIGSNVFRGVQIENFNTNFEYLESIGDGAFYMCNLPNNTSIYLSDKINHIGSDAFYAWRGNVNGTNVNYRWLKDVHVVGNSATTYGKGAFYQASNVINPAYVLNTFTLDNTNELPSGNTSHGIFESANTVTLNNVRKLNKYSIGNVQSSLTINGNGAIIGDGYAPVVGNRAYFSKNAYQDIVRYGPEYNLTLGGDITEIATSAFTNTGIIGSLVIPNSVTTIGDYALGVTADTYDATSRGANEYTSLTIGSGVTSIGENAFNPISLRSLTLVDGLRHMNYAFGGSGLTSVTLSNTLEEIPNAFLSGATSLSSITIPSSVTSIGNSAFQNCSGFTNIAIHNNITSVGDSAFSNCVSATSLSLGSSLRTIGASAFRNCRSLTTLNIPNNVLSIGTYAFYGCFNLGSIVINRATPPVLGNNAFDSTNDCTIYVPQESYELYINAEGWSAYRDRIWSTNVDYKALLISDGSNSIIHCSSGSHTLYQIPSNNATTIRVGNCVSNLATSCFTNSTLVESISLSDTVATVGDYAFANLQNLETVNFGSGATTIGIGAFSGCTALISISIQSGITSIGASAFTNCSGLTSIELPDSVTSIGESLFKGCSGLTSIRIPSGVTYMPNYLFDGCTSLETVYVPSGVTSFSSYTFTDRNNSSYINNNRPTPDIYFEALTPPTSGITSQTFNALERLFVPCVSYDAYKQAYSGITISYPSSKKLSTMIYMYGKEEYDEYRWDGETYICEDGNKYKQVEKYVSMDGITYYATGVYSLGDLLEASSYYCIPKAIISKDSGITYTVYCNDSHVLERSEVRGYSYTSLDGYATATAITIGHCVNELGDYALSDYRYLRRIYIPDGVTTIGDYCISSDNYYLSIITIPNSVTYIGKYAFYGKYRFPSENNIYYGDTLALESDSGLTEYTVKEGTRFINDYCFSNNSTLTSVNLPNSLYGIGQGAFQYCSGLTSIQIPSGVTYLGNTNDGVFRYCSSLTSCTFAENSQLKIISGGTFDNCFNLTSINLPSGITTIGNYAFSSCSGLTSINIPDSVTSIDDMAFSYCRSLVNCTIGSGVTSIGAGAFYQCSGLTNITILAPTPPTITSTNSGIGGGDCPILVPCGSVSAYQQAWFADGHSYDASRVLGIPPCDAKPNAKLYATYRNGGIKLVPCSNSDKTLKTGDTRTTVAPADSYLTMLTADVGDCVTTISGSVFSGCSQLSSVTLSDNITTIGTNLFRACGNLVSCNIPTGLTSIPNYTFYNCSGLTSINIPNNITSIGYDAFDYCSSLTSIVIPDSVTSIGTYLFRGCTSLTSCTLGSRVTSISNYDFSGCTSLTNITIPNSVTSIGTSAFRYSKLNSINIPSAVATIGDSAFSNCYELSSITVDSNNSVYDSRNNCNAIIKTSTNELVFGCNNTVIPDSITSIATYALFGYSGLTTVEIPSGVTNIGESAFTNCSNLQSITVLAETPPKLGNDAFIGTNACPIYVPQDSLTLYQAADYWSSYGTRIQPIPNS